MNQYKSDILITIVVPVYNVSPYIDECIKSIVNQDYSNIEIILINDGSTDDSLKKCVEWASRDGRISYYTQDNNGLSATRNKGVELAHGKYVSFIDSDDVVESNFISTLYDSISDENSDVSVVYLDDMNRRNSFILNNHSKTVSNAEAMNLLCSGKISISACVKLYKIELLREIPFVEGLIYEDNPFSYQIISRCNKIAVCEKILYHHRVREGSITRTFSKSNFYGYVKAMNMALECIENYYSRTDYRYIERCLYKWVIIERLYHEHYKNIFNRQESLNVKMEQRHLRKDIILNAPGESISCLSIRTKLKYFIMKYVPDLYYPLCKIYHMIKIGD